MEAAAERNLSLGFLLSTVFRPDSSLDCSVRSPVLRDVRPISPSATDVRLLQAFSVLVLPSLCGALLYKKGLTERRIRGSLPSFRLLRWPGRNGQLYSVSLWQRSPLPVVHFTSHRMGFVLRII